MTDAIIVALLSLVGNVIVSAISHRKTSALVTYRLEQLEKKVEKHNSVIERTYELEKDSSVIHNEIDHLKGMIEHD